MSVGFIPRTFSDLYMSGPRTTQQLNKMQSSLPQQPLSNEDVRAQKRTAVGLTPERETGKSVVQRPTAEQDNGVSPWLLMSILLLLLVLVLFLVAVRMGGMAERGIALQDQLPSWLNAPSAWVQGLRQSSTTVLDSVVPPPTEITQSNSVATTPQSIDPNGQQDLNAPAANGEIQWRLYMEEDFSRPQIALAQVEQPGRWLIGFVPGYEVYRIRPWPGFTAWTVLPDFDESYYRLETELTIDGVNNGVAQGYGGLIVRYADDQNFYLFTVDEQGRFQLLLQKDGIWSTLQPWTTNSAILGAGSPNLVAVEDNGQIVRFYVNKSMIAEISPTDLNVGAAGLAGGTQSQAIADINYDWLRVYVPE